jgi:hypothetical protein
LLLHVGNGYSLRETATRAKAAGLASVSDVAILDRLQTAGPWWRLMCARLLEENGMHVPEQTGGRVFRAADGTVIREHGKTGSSWRIHYTLRLPDLECDHFEITPARAKGGGETLSRLPVKPGDCLLADRGFCHSAGVLETISRGAELVVRLNTGNLPLYTASGRPFDLLGAVGGLPEAGQCGEWEVHVRAGTTVGQLRLCGIRKSQYGIQRALAQLLRQAGKQGHTPKPETLEYAKRSPAGGGSSVSRCINCAKPSIHRWRWRRRWRTGTRWQPISLNRAASAYPKCPRSSRGSAVKSA